MKQYVLIANTRGASALALKPRKPIDSVLHIDSYV